MAEEIDLKLSFEGDVPETLHVHLALSDDLEAILARLTAMETIMSDTSAALTGLTTAIGDASARVDEDVAHLQDLLEQALAAETADQATIEALRADAAETVARITESTSTLNSIDPLSDFPAEPAPEPVPEPAPEEPPVV